MDKEYYGPDVDTLEPTQRFLESDKCHLCKHPIVGEDARYMTRRVGYFVPRAFKAHIVTYEIRKHFIGHA